jgi:hypothetical protein
MCFGILEQLPGVRTCATPFANHLEGLRDLRVTSATFAVKKRYVVQ